MDGLAVPFQQFIANAQAIIFWLVSLGVLCRRASHHGPNARRGTWKPMVNRNHEPNRPQDHVHDDPAAR